jgi:magnesium-transporting ATPase (P-type)
MDPSYNYQYSGNDMPAASGSLLAFLGVFFLLFFIIFLAVYIYMAICLMKMAKKTNTENAWLAWIPIANIILTLQIAKKPLWWIILFFIPLVNIVMAIIVWMAIAEALGKPSWLGILIIIPIVNLIVPGYLAFSGNEAAPTVNTPPADIPPATPNPGPSANSV